MVYTNLTGVNFEQIFVQFLKAKIFVTVSIKQFFPTR